MIDHVFMFIEPNGPEIDYLRSLGLIETYRRVHHGQGTENICYCFDNMYLELLWVNDRTAVRSEAIARTGLHDRSMWRTNGACPFGIAWRSSLIGEVPHTWSFAPPYLPAGMSIAVATDGDDPRQPMMFKPPGSAPPIEWPIEKRGSLQHAKGLCDASEIRLVMPADVPPSSALSAIAQSESPTLRLDPCGPYQLRLTVKSSSKIPDLQIVLPI